MDAVYWIANSKIHFYGCSILDSQQHNTFLWMQYTGQPTAKYICMKPNRYNHYLRLSQQLGFELHLWTDQINNHTLKCPPHGLSHHSNSSWTFLSLKFLLDFSITHICTIKFLLDIPITHMYNQIYSWTFPLLTCTIKNNKETM